VPLQRSAHTGLLTDLSYIQFTGTTGVACLDLGVPVRYSHSALEVADPRDITALVSLLDAALTHRSAGRANYERLEFLGDSVLNFAVAVLVYRAYPEADEGDLSRYRASLVSGESLAEAALASSTGYPADARAVEPSTALLIPKAHPRSHRSEN